MAHRGAAHRLTVLAALSVGVGLVNAAHRSQDFQWSGVHLLLAHVDAWAEYLRDDPQHRLMLQQIPNYLPVLYAVLWPLGLLPLGAASVVWALCNVGFAIGSTLLAGQRYRLRRSSLVAIVCLMLMTTATRNSIGNGQQSLLVLFLWCATLLSAKIDWKTGAWGGISHCKYSFSPPLALYLFFRGGFRAVLASLLPVAAGMALIWLWMRGAPAPMTWRQLALEPFAVALRAYHSWSGDPNLMNLMQPLLHGISQPVASAIELGVACLICAAVLGVACSRRGEDAVGWQMALMATMSYALFNHHPYDAVVLLLPGCYAWSHVDRLPAKIILAFLAYLLYLQRILEALRLHPKWCVVPEFLMLAGILLLTFRLGSPGERLVEPAAERDDAIAVRLTA
jgi:hypothetical protein